MYSRLLKIPQNQSFFLFGPRGTGKSTWLRQNLQNALGAPESETVFLDLLNMELYFSLKASPRRLRNLIPPHHQGWVVLDEVQKIPELLSEVHALIEERSQLNFALTGSSARSLRSKGVNLLGGRALTLYFHPLTAQELGEDFQLERALRFGTLPMALTSQNPQEYLEAYVASYIREEVQQESLTRNIGHFYRFLESISFSQGAVLNLSSVARDCGVHRKVVDAYVGILEDLLIARRLPAFTKRAQRQLSQHPKFFFFDTGVYQAIRPRGPLDRLEEIEGPALETLFYQELRALNDYEKLGYDLYYWRTALGKEVDFVAYGPKGIHAFEVKRSRNFSRKDLKALKLFLKDYPQSRATFIYGGEQTYFKDNIKVLPFEKALRNLGKILKHETP